MSITAEHARTVVGIIGNVISLFLFLSPVPTFYKIYKAKSVQKFQVYPYIATVLNCVLWVFYGQPFVHPDSTLVVTINGAGLAIEIIYIIIYFTYANWGRRNVLYMLLVELVFIAVLIFCTLKFVHGTHHRTTVIGTICIVFNIIMYFSPLMVFYRVCKTKSVKYMPFYLSLANFLNGGVWLAYSLLKFDINLLVPNGMGTLSGAIQLALYAFFYKTTNWEEEEEEDEDKDGKPPGNKPGIELQNSKSNAELQV